MLILRFRNALFHLLLLMTVGSGSEPTEVNRIPPGDPRKRSKRSRNDILARFEEERRSKAAAIMDDTVSSITEKLNKLKMMTSDANLFLDLNSYLTEKEEANKDSNFLSLLSESKQKMMTKLVRNENDFNLLEKLIAREPEDVRRAFEKWKLAGKPKNIISIHDSTEEKNNAPDDQEESQNISMPSISENYTLKKTESPAEGSENITLDENPSEIDTKFLKNLPKCLTILVMGQTGSGKTTFINAVVNYLKYSSISEAQQKGIEILIKTGFTHVREDCQDVRIECEPTIQVERQDEEDEEEQEVTVVGESSTQSPRSYLFSFGPEENRKKIRIIDTPGVGDVRGLGQEKKNFDKILRFIANFPQIHAICILLKSNENRHTVTFRYCINELLTHLHVSASRNIIFGFTNARASLYTPGESLPTLREHLKKLKMKKNVDIQLNSETMFCFDNESFRFLCALSRGMNFSQQFINEFNNSWKRSVVETFRLFRRISELEPHKVVKTLSVNNIRRTLFAFVRPMAEIARAQLYNDELIEERQKEIENYILHGKELEGRLTSKELVIYPKELDYPVTVCTGKDCVEYKRFTDHPNARMEKIYKTKCHCRCELKNVQTETYPNTDLQNCWAMMLDINRCRNCGCPWSTHLHIRYELNHVLEEKVDPTIQTSIDNTDDKRKAAVRALQELKKTKEEKQHEIAFIRESCAELVAFLKKDSILPLNDAFADYVEFLIKEEQEKVHQGSDEAILNQLKQYRDDYKEHVRLLSQPGGPNTTKKKLKEVNEMIMEMKNLKHNGSILADVEKIELLSIRKQSAVKGKEIDLNSGWMGGIDVGVSGAVTKLKKKAGQQYGKVKKFTQYKM